MAFHIKPPGCKDSLVGMPEDHSRKCYRFTAGPTGSQEVRSACSRIWSRWILIWTQG